MRGVSSGRPWRNPASIVRRSNWSPSAASSWCPRRRPGHRIKSYDTSRSHIVASVENSLKCLRTDYIDLLLIHRPDPLIDPRAGQRGVREPAGFGQGPAFRRLELSAFAVRVAGLEAGRPSRDESDRVLGDESRRPCGRQRRFVPEAGYPSDGVVPAGRRPAVQGRFRAGSTPPRDAGENRPRGRQGRQSTRSPSRGS